MSTTKWLFALLASLILTAALFELSLPLLQDRYAVYFRRSIIPSTLNLEAARAFVGSKTFDPELGWDKDPIARNYVPTKRYLAQSYGDSFVEGGEVESEDTWQAHFERLTGQAILNLGVGGYGLDQALLKFEKYGRHYPTRIAILGLYHQTFRRALSYHSYYYFTNKDAFTFAFKPIFVKIDNRFELIRPPCADAACLIEVLSNPNHHVWRLAARYDYWYQNNQEKPAPGFPNMINFARVLRQILRQRREEQGAENYFFANTESLHLIEYLVERFATNSRNMGMTPVCLMLYSAHDLRVIKTGIRLDDKLLEFLAAKSIPYVDTAEYILKQYKEDDGFRALSALNGHLNSRGNLMVAESLAKGVGSMALLGH